MSYNADRYHRRRADMFDIVGHQCVECGSTDELHIHHKDPESKEFTLAAEWDRPWGIIVEELNKCEPLCRKCHIDEHRSRHGTLGRYSNYRCRCEPCKSVWNSHSKEYRRKRRAGVAKRLTATAL